MKKRDNPPVSRFGIYLIAFTLICPLALAKSKPQSDQKSADHEIRNSIRITGEATLTVKKEVALPQSEVTLKFQNGKIVEDVQYFQSPRCYLHFRKNVLTTQQLIHGHQLKINKIDNVYERGSVHVTFWFDGDPQVSNMKCITNYNHTLNTAELKSILSENFNILFSKSIEKEALFNTVPTRQAPVLSEDSANRSNFNSARIVLSDS